MPPRKQRLSKAEYRKNAGEHGIRLEGPVSPAQWPEELEHHFLAIQAIEALRYETYRNDQRIEKQQRKRNIKRAQLLRSRVCDLLNDVKINEATWRRKLEALIFDRFEQNVICRHCNNELTKSFVEAKCYNPHDQTTLQAKRAARRMCRCKTKQLLATAQDRDDERNPIFEFCIQTKVSHAVDDDLQHLGISMEPDCIVGLRAPSKLPQDKDLCPISGRRQIMMPFLVLEAKSDNGPGFSDIQYQTVFPIRRLLRAQTNLRECDSSSEPSLVWFFAYQGEQWRLYACVEDVQKVRIYEIWQRTIQSQDGALQLLLIVEYIWSWARDVYRPAIKMLIEKSMNEDQGLSPTSTGQFHRSLSLSSATSLQPSSQDKGPMELDQTNYHLDRSISNELQNEGKGVEDAQAAETYISCSASAIVLADAQPNPHMSINLLTTRHGYVIQFGSAIYQAYDTGLLDFGRGFPMKRLPLSVQCFPTFLMTYVEIKRVMSLWPYKPTRFCGRKGGTTLQVSFVFHTFYDRPATRINSVLSCVVWRSYPAQTAPNRAHGMRLAPPVFLGHKLDPLVIGDFEKAIIDVRQSRGRDPFSCALDEVTMAVSSKANANGLEWKSFEELGLIDTTDGEVEEIYGIAEFKETMNDRGTILRYQSATYPLWRIRGDELEHLSGRD